MIVPYPLKGKAKPDFKRETVRLFFEDIPSHDFHMRGAVTWPEGDNPGFCLIAGQEVESRVVWVFDEFQFVSIEHWFHQGELRERGLVEFLLRCWSDFFCRHFYYQQHEQINKRYLIQCLRSEMIQPKPAFSQVPYVDEDIADNVTREYINLLKMKINKGTLLADHLNTLDMGVEEQKVGVHALRCLLAGFEFSGWKDTYKEQELITYYLK